MDKLSAQLRVDAKRIEASVSSDLEKRIQASLTGVTPWADPAVRQSPRQSAHRNVKPAALWWASSLTGIAAAIVLVVWVNWMQQPALAPVTTPVAANYSSSPDPSNSSPMAPPIDLHAETAALTGPLKQEYSAVQTDLKRAEKQVRKQIGL